MRNRLFGLRNQRVDSRNNENAQKLARSRKPSRFYGLRRGQTLALEAVKSAQVVPGWEPRDSCCETLSFDLAEPNLLKHLAGSWKLACALPPSRAQGTKLAMRFAWRNFAWANGAGGNGSPCGGSRVRVRIDQPDQRECEYRLPPNSRTEPAVGDGETIPYIKAEQNE